MQGSVQQLKTCRKCKTEFEEYEWGAIYCQPCLEIIKGNCEATRIEQEIQSIIPKIYQNTDTDRDIKDFAYKSIFCHGTAGTGKTQFIASLAKFYLRAHGGVIWLSFPTYIMKLQTMYRDDKNDPFEYVMGMAKTEKTVILDDIGIEKMSDFVRQVTYMLINERYQRQLLTLITSNKTLAEIDNLIHPGIASRIAGMCQVLEFKGKDLRIRK